jgi:hypothetical protein
MLTAAALLTLTATPWGAAELSAVSNPAPTDAAWVVTGEGFDAQTRFLLWTPSLHVDAKGKPIADQTWIRWLNGPKSLPASPPAEALALKVLALDPQVAALEMPDSPPKTWGYRSGTFRGKLTGLLWARSKQGVSRPFVVNRPQIYFVRPQRVAAGSLVRVIGRNFRSHYYQGHGFVVLRHKTTGKIVRPTRVSLYAHGSEGRLEDAQRWVRIPANLPAGPYDVLVCNRSGGPLGWSAPVDLTVLAEAPNVVEHAIRLEKADTQAMKAALAKAKAIAARGPGHRAVILIPTGRFHLSDRFSVPFPVTIRGAGMDNTFLVRADKPGRPRHRQARFETGSGFVIEHLSLEGVPVSMSRPDRDGLVRDCALRRVRISTMISGKRCRRLEISGCHFTAGGRTWFKNMDRANLSFNHSETPQWLSGQGGLTFREASQHSILEHNSIQAPRGYIFHKWQELGHVRNLIYCNSVYDTQTWDGEGMLVEGAGKVYGARIAKAGARSVTLDGGEFEPDQLRGKVIVVTRGRGLGQYRLVAGNKGRDLTLAEPWCVVPASGSNVTLAGGAVENIFACNRLRLSYAGGPLLYHACAMGNRLFDNRLTQSAGMYLWSLRRPGRDVADKKTPVIVPDYWNTHEGNILNQQTQFFFTFGMTQPVSRRFEGVLQLGNTLRRNRIAHAYSLRWGHLDAPGAVSLSTSTYRRFLKEKLTGADKWEAAHWFTMIDANHISHCPLGVYVSKRSYRVILRRNRFEQVPEPLRDQGIKTVRVGEDVTTDSH